MAWPKCAPYICPIQWVRACWRGMPALYAAWLKISYLWLLAVLIVLNGFLISEFVQGWLFISYLLNLYCYFKALMPSFLKCLKYSSEGYHAIFNPSYLCLCRSFSRNTLMHCHNMPPVLLLSSLSQRGSAGWEDSWGRLNIAILNTEDKQNTTVTYVVYYKSLEGDTAFIPTSVGLGFWSITQHKWSS